MKNLSDLKRELEKIDGRGYKTYKTLEGQYSFEDYILSIDHVQGDPFASPSRIRVIVNSNNNFPKNLFDEKYKKITICDFLTRLFSKNIYKYGEKVFGSGKSGLIEISKCSQQVIERTSIIINNEKIEARFYVGFPARGRSVLYTCKSDSSQICITCIGVKFRLTRIYPLAYVWTTSNLFPHFYK